MSPWDGWALPYLMEANALVHRNSSRTFFRCGDVARIDEAAEVFRLIACNGSVRAVLTYGKRQAQQKEPAKSRPMGH